MPIIKLQGSSQYITCQHIPHRVYSQVLWTVYTMPAGTNYRFTLTAITLYYNPLSMPIIKLQGSSQYITCQRIPHRVYSQVLWTVYTMPAGTNYRFTLTAITLYYNPLPMPIIKLQGSSQYITCQRIPHRSL